jgi:hypothetical protein
MLAAILQSLSSHLLSKNIYKTIPVLLYRCEIWSHIVREEQRLRVSENKALWRIYGTKREGITEGQRKLHNKDFCTYVPTYLPN